MTRLFTVYNVISLIIAWCASLVKSQGLPTSSPAIEFLSRPVNRTVLEGSPAILRCKIRDLVHTCQWFYLEPGLSFYDAETTPVFVKEFRPTGDRDCSIKFNKARLVQNGQWLCKGLQVQQRKYIVSEPVFLRVIAHDENLPRSTTDANLLKPENIFSVSEDGHIINTELGLSNNLECNVYRPIRHCSWISPNGKRISMEEASLDTNRYEMQYDLSGGSCPLYITNVSLPDEGNWRCVVNIEDEVGERVGPLVHLHLSQFDVHHGRPQNPVVDTELDSDDNSLQVILIGVSVLLVVIVIVLVVLICRKGTSLLRKRADPEVEEATAPNQTDSHCTPAHKLDQSFSPSFIPTIGLGRNPRQHTSIPNHYTRYLDMTGRASTNRDEYVMFPPGTRAPAPVPNMNPLPTDRSSSFSGISGSTIVPASHRTMHSFDNGSFQTEPYYMRQGSLYNGSHLYEEIDERHAQLAEDGEGYMLPRRSNAPHAELQLSSTEDQPPITPERGYIQREMQRRSSNEVHSSDVTSGGVIGYDLTREPPRPVRSDLTSPENQILSELSNCTPVLV